NCTSILSKEESLRLISSFRQLGIKKINYAGGEPTLCPYLGDLLRFSKQLGMTTSIISNGTGITKSFLEKYSNAIDWLGISIDSGSEEVQRQLGRGNGNHVALTIRKAEMIKEFQINLKINTVVTALTFQEDMNWLLEILKPKRWKVFQVLHVKNENNNIQDLLISEDQFKIFIETHSIHDPIAETNDLMLESYLMVDPCGRFFQNSNNEYSCSNNILEVGIDTAINEISWDKRKFLRRGGSYNW
ncbi:MAG: viperin family antiviral radical SAM protein, partial [Candidatus Helarchaeota archaeon]